MGLFDDFDIDMDEIKEAGNYEIKDGTYPFEITEALRQNGSKNNPDNTFFIIKYDLDEAGEYQEWFTLAVDGDTEHPDAKRSLGYLKTRLLALGFQAAELNAVEPEDLEGIRGSFSLVSSQGKGKNAHKTYQNIRNFTVEDEGAPEPEPAPAPKTDTKAADAAAKQRVAARRAEREAQAAPATTRTRPTRGRAAAPAQEEDAANPFE